MYGTNSYESGVCGIDVCEIGWLGKGEVGRFPLFTVTKRKGRSFLFELNDKNTYSIQGKHD
jgi:hypothetical protein